MRSYFLILFFIITPTTWSNNSSSYLKEIQRCELVFDEDSFLPSGEVTISILTTLKDGTQYSSLGSVLQMNFANYNFSLKGPAKVIKKSRKSITLKIDEDAYNNPYLILGISMRRDKAISWEKKIPIRYDLFQAISFVGRDGYDPRTSTDNGYRTIPLGGSRVNIQFIDDGGTLSNNSDPNIVGEKGKDITIFMSIIQSNAGDEIVKIRINPEESLPQFKYFLPGMGGLEVFSIGGKGGISKSGGKGGNGGDVTIYVRPEARPYLDQLYISNYGGRGGDVWRPQEGEKNIGPHGVIGKIEIINWED